MAHLLVCIDDSGTSSVATCQCGQSWLALDPEIALRQAADHGTVIDYFEARETLRRERARNWVADLDTVGLSRSEVALRAREGEVPVEEIAIALGVSRSTVYNWLNRQSETGRSRKEARAAHARALATEGNTRAEIIRLTGWNGTTVDRYFRGAA
ncbi:helix-turn-helix domain-containing protein [Microbacterium saperdae]